MKAFKILLFLAVAIWSGCSPNQAPEEPISLQKEFINQTNGYSQAVVTDDGRTRTIHISGQIGQGDTFDQQMRSAIANLEGTLKEAGATLSDVVKMNTYIVDYNPERLAEFRSVRKELLGDARMPASTLVGVQALALPEWLIEIEAVAVTESAIR